MSQQYHRERSAGPPPPPQPGSNRSSTMNPEFIMYEQPPRVAHPQHLAVPVYPEETDLDNDGGGEPVLYGPVPEGNMSSDDEIFVSHHHPHPHYPSDTDDELVEMYADGVNQNRKDHQRPDREEEDDLLGLIVGPKPSPGPQMGIYGWRKKIIYILIVVIIVLIALNAALTLWIVYALGLTTNGISGIDLSHEDRIQFKGSAYFRQHLFAAQVGSYPGTPTSALRFDAPAGENITFRSSWESAPNSTTNQSTQLTIGGGRVQIRADAFEIRDRQHRLMFGVEAEPEEEEEEGAAMTIRADRLRVLGLNRFRLSRSLQTPTIDSGAPTSGNNRGDLQLLAPLGSVAIRGPRSVSIESKLGDASIITYEELRLQSNSGKIILESSPAGIYIRQLTAVIPTAQKSRPQPGGNSSQSVRILDQLLQTPKVYQLCICETGKLFLVLPDRQCQVQAVKDCL